MLILITVTSVLTVSIVYLGLGSQYIPETRCVPRMYGLRPIVPAYYTILPASSHIV